jgi:hypothetical protein
MYQFNLLFLADMKFNYGAFWTSGINDGIHMERKWGWCPSGTLMGSGYAWYLNEPNYILVENCAFLKLHSTIATENAMANHFCTTLQRFICEVR